MTILGVDPGTNVTGFGVVRWERNRLTYVDSGILFLSDAHSLHHKLKAIYADIGAIVNRFRPTEMSIENVFYSRNVKSALKLGHARGAAILAALHHGLSISEYTPKEMKMAIVGNGAAGKEQVRYMVRQLLHIERELELDESDALGLAICHAHRVRSPRAKISSWKEYVKAHPELIKK